MGPVYYSSVTIFFRPTLARGYSKYLISNPRFLCKASGTNGFNLISISLQIKIKKANLTSMQD